MIFSKTKMDGIWKFEGKCRDKEGQVWYFYTQHKLQFLSFKDRGSFGEMKFLEGENQTAKYKAIKKLEGEK